MFFFHWRLFSLTAMACLSIVVCMTAWAEPYQSQDQTQTAAAEPDLTEEEIKQFLLTAKVVRSRETGKGVTHPFRLTLSDGRLTHDAEFQSIEVYKPRMSFFGGATELNFRDSYHYNIAAYELAKLLGLGNMMPVTVEREWKGEKGSLAWWIDVEMDEAERVTKNIIPPDPEAWNEQVFRKRVFAELVRDSDPNLTNVLIGHNWELYMIDFSRAFRWHEDLEKPERLKRCDRQLLEKLRQLNKEEIEGVTKPHLSDREIKALLKRRDKIIDHFQKLIDEKGEEQILY